MRKKLMCACPDGRCWTGLTGKLGLTGLAILFCVLSSMASGFSQNRINRLVLKDVTLSEAVKKLAEMGNCKFVFNYDDLNKYRVSADLENKDVRECLDLLLKDKPFRSEFQDGLIYISFSPNKKTVKLYGKVTDKSGQPLPGVSVFLEGTTIGTSTDIDGKYELSLPGGKAVRVVCSFIGMKNVVFDFPCQQNLEHNVVLVADDVKLEDVVVIGYGVKSQRNVTSSVASLKTEDMEKYANGTSTFDKMLGGAMKGVMVTQNSGDPGGKATLNVRGITSPVSGSTNEPLYVINGVPFFIQGGYQNVNPLMSISPNDIESIDVLKDAAATAIYGSRGANGVVIINTKSGRRNEKMHLTAGYTLSIGNPVKRFKPLNTAEFKEVQDLLMRNSVDAYNKGEIQPSEWAQWNTGMDKLGKISLGEDGKYVYSGLNDAGFGTANTDWSREIQNKNALNHQYMLNIRGGGEKTNYSFSVNATNQEGLYIRDKLQNYATTLSLDTDLSKRLTAGASLNYSFTKRFYGTNSDPSQGKTQPWLVRPDVSVYNEKKELNRIERDGNYLYASPVGSYQENNDTRTQQFIGSGYMSLKILENLKVRGDISVALFNTHNYDFIPIAAQNIQIGNESATRSSGNDSRDQVANTSVNFRMDYSLQREEHSFSAMLGYGWDRTYNESMGLLMFGFPDDEVLNNLTSGTTYSPSSKDSKVVSGLNSVYARVGYNFSEKYLAEFNFRSDASSKFGPGNRRAYFPAASLGWRISKENFMAGLDRIDDLKLRLSWGQTGSTNIGDFLYRQFYVSGLPYLSNTTLVPNDALPNPDVRWEMTTEYNGGLDFTFFNRRLFGSIDLYRRYTRGALAPSPYPKESGAGRFTSNLIDLSNKGVEFQINGDMIRGEKVVWVSSFNIAFNRNKIEKLNGANLLPSQIDACVEGYPAGSLKGYVVEKIFTDQEEIAALNKAAKEKGQPAYQKPGTGIGDYKFKDVDGNGYINSDDREVIATSEPRFFGGLSSSVSYGYFNLSIGFQFSKGAKAAWSSFASSTSVSPGQSIYRELYHNSWTPENPNARYARLVSPNPNTNSRISDRFVYETSYLRLKNINLSYSLPQPFLKKLNVQSCLIFAGISNIWTLTKWPGLDPELTGAGLGSSSQSQDPYPLSKNFTLGIKVEF